MEFWRKFAFKHTVASLVTIVIFILLLDTVIVQTLLQEITSLGYVGIFLTGVIFVSFFTAAPAIALLLAFADSYNPLLIAVIGGFGAMIGDLLILRFAEDRIGHELEPVAKKMKLTGFINQLHKKRFKPLTATVGAIIIASPLPDEAGIALLGLSRISTLNLMLLTFALNGAGMLLLILAFN